MCGNREDREFKFITEIKQEKFTYYMSAVEVVDPMILEAKIVEPNHHCGCGCGCNLSEVPPSICQSFGQDICLNDCGRKLFVTLGQFSIIRLERDIQLLMPAYDICIPDQDCSCSTMDPQDPCDVFDNFEFPVDEFFPPRCQTPRKSNCNSCQTPCRPPNSGGNSCKAPGTNPGCNTNSNSCGGGHTCC